MIIALSGRRIDQVGAQIARFPLDNVGFVRDRIRKLLLEEKVTAVVSSAACGADLLTLREAGALGIKRRVVLPFDRARFRETSVRDRPGDWTFYDAVIDQISESGDLITLDDAFDEKRSYAAANGQIISEARRLGQVSGEEVRALLVWDGRSRGPEDYTESFGQSARNHGLGILEVLTLRTCFVLQGFGEKTDLFTGRVLNLDASYEVIKEGVEEAGLRCIRADEIIHSGTIDKPMYQWIYSADIVIADLSTYNVNAAYELGVRYGLRPGLTMIVADTQFKNPFDVSHIAIVRYEHLGKDIGHGEAVRFKRLLTERITKLLREDAIDSPVYTLLPLRPPCECDAMQSPADRDKIEASAQLGLAPNAKDMLEDGRAAIAAGNFTEARVLFKALGKLLPRDPYLTQQLALAIYKSKLPDPITALFEAQTSLKTLAPETSNDPETLGLWGAIHKRLWELKQDSSALNMSFNAYERGFYLRQDFYNGINYAFLLNVRARQYQIAGEKHESIADYVLARRVRRSVLADCESVLKAGSVAPETTYWVVATMWEAAVGLEDADGAARYASQARGLAGAQWMLDATNEQIIKLQALLAPSPLDR